MIKGKSLSLLLLTPAFGLFVFFAYANVAHAANACVSAGTGNWNTVGTWTGCGSGVPTADDSVTILTGHIVTVDTVALANTVVINANAAVGGNGISINSGQSLTVTGAVTLNIPTAATADLAVGAGALTAGSIAIPGSATANRFATVSVSTGTVTVSGSITFTGSAARARYTSTGTSITNIGGDFGAGGTLATSGTGTFNFNGSVAQIIGAYTTYNNIQINNSSGGVTFSGTTTVGGTLLVNTGTLDMANISATITGATTINGTLRISSVTGTKTFGDITIANGGILNFAATEVMTHLGSLTVNGTGTITGTTGVWAFQKVGGGTISGTASSIAITSATFTTSYTSSIPTTYTGTVTVTGAAVVLTNNSTLTINTALSGTGKLTQGTSSILNIGGTSAITGLDASANPNEVHYTSAAANQTIKAVTSAYHHLFIEKLGRVGTLAAATTINGNLSVTAGTLADGGFQITGNGTGTFTLAANTTLTLGIVAAATSFPTSFTTGNTSLDAASTVNYNSNLAQIISSVQNYGNLTLTATAAVTKTAADNLTVNGTLTNGVNNTLADGGFILTLKGDGTMTGTHAGSGKILFTGGSVVHSVIGNFTNVELNDSNGAIQSGTVNISGTMTITSGAWSVNGKTLTVTGDTSISGTLSITSTSGTKTFGNITINSGGTIAFSAAEAVTVNGDLIVNGTGVITGTSGIWTFQKVGGGTIGGTAASLTILGSTTFATVYAILLPYTVNTMTVSAGVNETNLSTMTINTSLAGAGTLTQSVNAILNLGGGTTITTLDASANPNEVHYINTTANQTIKTANYYHLFIDKSAQTATVSGTTNVLGNLRLGSGILSLGASILTVTGTTDIYGTIQDLNNSGSATFGGLITVYSGGSWSGNAGEACDFNFLNGFSFSGTGFVTGGGVYTFLTNNQSISGSSAISVKNLVVTGIQLTNNSAAPLTIDTELSGTGELIQGTNASLSIGGTSAITTLTASASGNSVFYNSAAAQAIIPTIYQTLDVSGNTSSNVTITADTTANTALFLGATIFSTGVNKIIMGAGATLTRTTGFVNGNLQKNIPTGEAAPTFEVGSGSDYTPVRLDFNTVTVPGNILVYTTGNDHPNIATSQLIANKTANRFYTISNSGVSFDTYDAIFTFVPTDVDADAITANFVLAKFDSGAWVRPALSAVTATSVSSTQLTSMSDFQIGEFDVVSTTLVSIAHEDGTFAVGETIDFTIQYSATVVVAGGTPSLALNTSGTAFYVSGSGTDTLTFRYDVLPAENVTSLDYTSTGALSLNGATIQDMGAENTNNVLPSVGTLTGSHAITIDTNPTPTNDYSTTFKNFLLGEVYQQDGWTSGHVSLDCPLYDVVVVENAYGYASFGGRSMRISNAIACTSFIDQTFSQSMADEAGESSASTSIFSGGIRQPYFATQWDFASTVPGSEQPGLSVEVSPSRGDEMRMSWLQMEDTPTGLQLNFEDYQHSLSNFVITPVATGLDRTIVHTVRMTMQFIDGAENDIVRVYVDGVLVHTGTSWEDYYRDVAGSATFPVDSVMFRVPVAAGLGTLGNGFLIDNFSSFSGSVPAPSTPDSVATVPITISNKNILTVVEQVNNDKGGTATYSDFTLFVNGVPITSGESKSFAPGVYTVSETNLPGYTLHFTGDCDANGNVTLGGVDTKAAVCTVVNNDIGVPVVAPTPPLIDVIKIPEPLALPGGPGLVTYTYTATNIGTVPMTDVALIGDTCSPLLFISGDTNNDSRLDVTETWIYQCTMTLSETHTNTVVAMGHANGLTATHITNATVVVGAPILPPLIHVIKIPTPLMLPAGGGQVTYTMTVTNPGVVALSNVGVAEDILGSPVRYVSGDTNDDSKLDPNETWIYIYQANLTNTITNTVVASGLANGFVATDVALATVVVAAPALPNTGLLFLRDLKFGSTGTDVRALQQYLNARGYLLADSGHGSQDYETQYFGRLTQLALIKFQKDNNIVPAIGYCGPITRAVMNK